MKDRIQKLLGQGLSPKLVASAVGCDESYISQLLQDQGFALNVAEARCKEIEVIRERDIKYDTLEDQLIKKLEDILPIMLRPREILHAPQVINQARRRSEEFLMDKSAAPSITNVVVLSIPEKVVKQFELNHSNQIVSIEGRPLIPVSTNSLLTELRASQSGIGEKNAAVTFHEDAIGKASKDHELSEKIKRQILSIDSI